MDNNKQNNEPYLNTIEFIEKAYFKELDMIQSIINRMAQNSFLIKGWTITLVVVTMLIKGGFSQIWGALLAVVPLLMFWILDGFFLNQEKLYRNLQNWVIENRLYSTPPQKNNGVRKWFDMNATEFTDKNTGWGKVVFSKTLRLFYGGILFLLLAYTIIKICFPILS